jgi:hypothetical protein
MFKVGDKLEADEFDKLQYDIEYVTITSINKRNKIYHWEALEKWFGGKIHSGYRFEDAKLYISKEDKRDNTLNNLLGE